MGAPYYDDEGASGSSHVGHVRVFQYNPAGGGEGTGAWEQLGNDIDGTYLPVDAGVGYSVSLSSDGTAIATGANVEW